MAVSDQAIMDVLAQRLGVSVLNLCASLAVSQDELGARLADLKRAGRVRTVRPSCAGTCSGCASCPEGGQEPAGFTPDTVVISLERALRAE